MQSSVNKQLEEHFEMIWDQFKELQVYEKARAQEGYEHNLFVERNGKKYNVSIRIEQKDTLYIDRPRFEVCIQADTWVDYTDPGLDKEETNMKHVSELLTMMDGRGKIRSGWAVKKDKGCCFFIACQIDKQAMYTASLEVKFTHIDESPSWVQWALEFFGKWDNQ